MRHGQEAKGRVGCGYAGAKHHTGPETGLLSSAHRGRGLPGQTALDTRGVTAMDSRSRVKLAPYNGV